MNDTTRSILVGTIGLDLALVVAVLLALGRRAGHPAAARPVIRAGSIALLTQSIHFLEEALTGFPLRFAPLFGLDPWPPAFFVTFNLVWIALWIVSILAIPAVPRLASIPLWFLGVAGLFNLVAHPVLALVSRGYFPGLWSSPLIGLAGVLLLRRLWNWTNEQVRV